MAQADAKQMIVGLDIGTSKVVAVVGHQAEKVEEAFRSRVPEIETVLQSEQKGTGHAVSQALPTLSADDQLLILYGDVPLIPARLLKELVRDTAEQSLGLIWFFYQKSVL